MDNLLNCLLINSFTPELYDSQTHKGWSEGEEGDEWFQK